MLAAGAVLLAAAAVCVAVWAGRARIEGATATDRLASIREVADARPWGAEETLGHAATTEEAPECRQAAVVALSYRPTPEVRGFLEDATRDAAPGVRAAAAAALGLYADEAALARLSELALKDAESEVRMAAVTGLGRHRSVASLAWIVEAAGREEDVDAIRHAIATVYHRLGMRYIGAQVEAADARAAALTVVENLKDDVTVRRAYEAAGLRIVHNPQYYIPPLSEADPRQRGL